MPSRTQHREIGRKSALRDYENWIEAKGRSHNPFEARLCEIIGSKSAEFPDILEPPTSPHHRGKAHSWEALLLLRYLTSQSKMESDMEFPDLLCLIAAKGYMSHLLTDQSTTMGLYSIAGSAIRKLLDGF